MRKESYKDYIRRQHLHLRNILNLGEWEGGLRFSEVDHPEDAKVGNGLTINGECDVHMNYLSYTITMYPICEKKFNEERHNEVFMTLLHEMCHVLSQPLYERAIEHCLPGESKWVEQLREQTTQRVTYIVYSNTGAGQLNPFEFPETIEDAAFDTKFADKAPVEIQGIAVEEEAQSVDVPRCTKYSDFRKQECGYEIPCRVHQRSEWKKLNPDKKK